MQWRGANKHLKHRRRSKDNDLSRDDNALTLCTLAPAGTDAAGPQAYSWRRLRATRVLERKRENNVHPGSHSILSNHQRQLFGHMIPAPEAVRSQAAIFSLEQRGISSRQIELAAWIECAGKIRYGNQGSVLRWSQRHNMSKCQRLNFDRPPHSVHCHHENANNKQEEKGGVERRIRREWRDLHRNVRHNCDSQLVNLARIRGALPDFFPEEGRCTDLERRSISRLQAANGIATCARI